MKKRRPEILRPGLKLQTPHEKLKTDLRLLSNRKRWEHLFHPDRNRWVLIK